MGSLPAVKRAGGRGVGWGVKLTTHTCLMFQMGQGATADFNRNLSLQITFNPEPVKGSRKLRFPDFVTTAQDGGRL